MRLTDFTTLTFDCYGTLIDWESGMVAGLRPLTDRLDGELSRNAILEAHAFHESTQQKQTPARKYRDLLPESLAPALDSMFVSLQRERDREYRKLARTFRHAWYTRLLTDWEAFLEDQGSSSPVVASQRHAAVPVIVPAGKWIRKRHRKVLEYGSRLTDRSPDADLHTLRIECKKLRYLLEFFASLYSAETVQTLVAQLKKLQDNLGEFNDLSVQQVDLKAYLEAPARQAGGDAAEAAAVGGLIAGLHGQQQEVRGAFQKTFQAFASEQNRKLFRQLTSRK